MKLQRPKDTFTLDELMKTITAFQKSRIILSAFELGIFTALDGDAKSSETVASMLETDHRATDRLLNALCAIKLIIKQDGLFSNSRLASGYLVKGKTDYLLHLMHTSHGWDNWHKLTDAIRTGKSPTVQPFDDRDEAWFAAFIDTMHKRGISQAKEIAQLLDLLNVNTVLDIGGGSGVFSIGFVDAKKDIRATVFDLPQVTTLTKKYIAQAGLSHAIDTKEGDYMKTDFGSGYDLILLSAIIHINSYSENRDLISRCAKALNKDGLLVVQDYIMSEDRTTPEKGTIFSLHMLVSTEKGDTYTYQEVNEWMQAAGIQNIHQKNTSFGNSLVIGTK